VAAVGQKLRVCMRDLGVRGIERSRRLRCTTLRGNLVQDADWPRAEHDDVCGAPRTSAPYDDIGNVPRGSARDLNCLQLRRRSGNEAN
jgi:hypothetical protein